ncbi:glycosyltransferase [Myroides sp. LJL119]
MYNYDDLISIVIPVYNAEKYLGACIDSVVNQSYKKIEIILVNDGSVDGSSEICDLFANKYSNIKVIHQENQGVSLARNNGLKICSGRWVTFVDSDDYIESNFILSFIELGLSRDCLIIQDIKEKKLNGVISVIKGSVYGSFKISQLEDLISSGDILSKRYVCCKFYNIDVIRENNVTFKEGIKYGEDLIFFLEYLLAVKKIIISNTAHYIYRRNDSSATYKIFTFGQYDQIIVELESVIFKLQKKYSLQDNFKVKELLGMFNWLAIVSIFYRSSLTSRERVNYLEKLKSRETFSYAQNYLVKRRFHFFEIFALKQIWKENYTIVSSFLPLYLASYFKLRSSKNSLMKKFVKIN